MSLELQLGIRISSPARVVYVYHDHPRFLGPLTWACFGTAREPGIFIAIHSCPLKEPSLSLSPVCIMHALPHPIVGGVWVAPILNLTALCLSCPLVFLLSGLRPSGEPFPGGLCGQIVCISRQEKLALELPLGCSQLSPALHFTGCLILQNYVAIAYVLKTIPQSHRFRLNWWKPFSLTISNYITSVPCYSF